jgi:hypothetical protein
VPLGESSSSSGSGSFACAAAALAEAPTHPAASAAAITALPKTRLITLAFTSGGLAAALPPGRLKDRVRRPAGLRAQSAARTFRAPSTIEASLRRDAQRAVWDRPQSGETESRSGGTWRRQARIRSSTSSGDST